MFTTTSTRSALLHPRRSTMAITRDWRRQPVFSRSTFGMHMLDPEAFDVPRSTAPKVDAAVAVAMAKVVDSRKTPLGRFRLTR